jgi:flagellar hook-associated protein 1 FlgK
MPAARVPLVTVECFMNLANLGLSGLAVAQGRLQATGHNINNAATEGYSRQSLIVATAGAGATSAGFIGHGVQSVTVQRAYDGFLFRQLTQAQTAQAAITAYGAEISQINNQLADRTAGITPALQKFFDAMHAVASVPADSAARQELLGRAASLVGQINDTHGFMVSQRDNINNQIRTAVTQVNSYAERIRDLNMRIVSARAAAPGHEPNDLLDQRNLTVGKGQILLAGDTVFPLRAQPSAMEPSRVGVAYTVPGNAGETAEMPFSEGVLQGGALGGLLAYRSQALDAVQNDLGRLAIGLALAFNALHREGQGLDGSSGEDFFSVPDATVLASPDNEGAPGLAVRIQDANLLTAQDYRVERGEAGFRVVSVPAGAVSVFEGDEGVLDGLVFAMDDTAAAGDAWLVQPARSAAGYLKLALNDPARVAAASPDAGSANGDVALALAQLQTARLLDNGAMSLNEAYSQIVNKVGVLTQQNATQARAQATLAQRNSAALQAVSGVNLNEEYVNLMRAQEMFMAASRLIDVSGMLFDTLLGLRH